MVKQTDLVAVITTLTLAALKRLAADLRLNFPALKAA
jgi:hypothetical protein